MVAKNTGGRYRLTLSEQQIAQMLTEYSSGERVPDLLSRYGITDRSFYRLKKQHSVPSYSGPRRETLYPQSDHQLII